MYEIVNSNIPELKPGVYLTVLQGSIWIPIFFYQRQSILSLDSIWKLLSPK